MARDLARDYRLRFGGALRTDAMAVDTMQRYLLGQAAEVLAGKRDVRSLAPDIVRHGALLGVVDEF